MIPCSRQRPFVAGESLARGRHVEVAGEDADPGMPGVDHVLDGHDRTRLVVDEDGIGLEPLDAPVDLHDHDVLVHQPARCLRFFEVGVTISASTRIPSSSLRYSRSIFGSSSLLHRTTR